MSSPSKNIGSLLPSLPPPPQPHGEKSQIFHGARDPNEVDQAGSRQAESRAFQNLGTMEAWRLVACLSTLFPKARIEKTGILAPAPTLVETGAGSSGGTAENKYEKGADTRVSGIRR